MLVTVKVEERHRLHGRVQNCHGCPGSLAIAELLANGYGCIMGHLEEGWQNFCIVNEMRSTVYRGDVPANFQKWQKKGCDLESEGEFATFGGSKLPDIEFQVDIPEEYLKQEVVDACKS